MMAHFNVEAELSNLARKAGGGRRVKDAGAFFKSLGEENVPEEVLRRLFYRDELQEIKQKNNETDESGSNSI